MFPIQSSIRTVAAILAIAAIPLGAAADNHSKVVAPVAPGTYAVGCSDIAQDPSRIAQIGGLPSDFWEGVPQNGQLRYITQILSDSQGPLQFTLPIPDDSGLYPHFHADTLPFVTLVCYPTAPDNPHPDYALPDGQVVPHMQRNGDLPVFPDASRFPLVVHSHGLGGSPISKDYLSTIVLLASHGYVVLAPFHGDARIVQLSINDLNSLSFFLLHFDRYVELQAMRPLALKGALDDLLARPEFAAHIDTQKIGGFGASLGGEAMLLEMGAHLTTDFTRLDARAAAQDPRIKAAVGYVPYAGQTFLPAFGNDQSGMDFVTRPFLAIAGTADVTAPIVMSQQAVNRLTGTRYLVALTGVPHEYKTVYADDVFTWTLTFLDAHVKDDLPALSRLVQMKAVQGGLDDQLLIDYTAPTLLKSGEALATEYFYAPLGHFFVAASDAERAFGDTNPGWGRTGQAFKTLASASPVSVLGATQTPVPVCRYFGVAPMQPTFFYSAATAECDFLRVNNHGWRDLGTAFYEFPADPQGNCADGEIAVHRTYNNGWVPPKFEANHRYTTSLSSVADMVRNGSRDEGVAFCAPL